MDNIVEEKIDVSKEDLKSDLKNLLIVVAIKDIKVGLYGNLIVMQNIDTAVRYFDVQMNNLKKAGYQSCDFQLFKIGYYNQNTGDLVPEFEYIKEGE